MSSATIPETFDVDAMLAGAAAPLAELLRRQSSGASPLAEAFRTAWRQRSALHADVQDVCEPLFVALAGLDAASWAAAPSHDVWRVFALVQRGSVGYQPELGRAGEKLLADLAAALAPAGDWSAQANALNNWWTQEQQRLGRLEQRLVDTERGQLRSRRAQQMAARLLNQTMAGRRFAREVVAYLQGEWFQELQWALLQFGADSEQWQRRALLTERLIESLQPPEDDDAARQQLYALIPDVGAELAALLDERAHDRGILEQQLALIESQHLLLLRGKTPPASDYQLIANDDPWLSTTTVSASLLQRVAVLEAGNWFLLNDDGGLRVKLALKLDDSTQLLFVNRLGVKSLQKSFEEFAYLLSVGAAVQLPDAECARAALRSVLADMAQRSADDHEERAEARRQADAEARLRIEAKAKAIAEAKALAEAQARAEAEEAAQREAEERERRLMEERRLLEERQAAEERVRAQQLLEERERLERQRQHEQEQRAEEQGRVEEQQRIEAQQKLEEQRQLEERQKLDEQQRAAQAQTELQERQQREEGQRRAQERSETAAAAIAPEIVAPAPVDEQRLRAARREAGLLPIGSWLELLQADGSARRLKVAVKLPSSGKLILVDRDGVRQAEFDRDALAQSLCDGSARILNQGPKFEDTLAKVVDSMRRDRAPRE